MSKEKILNKHVTDGTGIEVTQDEALRAMDDYAEQEAIAFADFSSRWEYLNWGGDKGSGWHEGGDYNTKPLSTSELYQLFKQQP